MRRTLWWVTAGVIAVAVVVLFVLPARTLLHQRSTLDHTRHQLQVIDQENAKLAATAASLQTDAEIERLARERYGLVMPGQQAYVVLPAAVGATTSTTTPTGGPAAP